LSKDFSDTRAFALISDSEGLLIHECTHAGSDHRIQEGSMTDSTDADKSIANKAHEALIARLALLDRKPIRVRPPQSLQPTPEAAKSRVRRLRRKRLLMQRSERAAVTPAKNPPAHERTAP
jgi:hypothetical protein